MAHRGARWKDTYIQQLWHAFEAVVDRLGEEIHQNLSVAQLLHDSHEMEQYPQEQKSRLKTHEHQHVDQLKAIKALHWETLDVIEHHHQLLFDVQAKERKRGRMMTLLLTKGRKEHQAPN